MNLAGEKEDGRRWSGHPPFPPAYFSLKVMKKLLSALSQNISRSSRILYFTVKESDEPYFSLLKESDKPLQDKPLAISISCNYYWILCVNMFVKDDI